jgi:hypothetical protein
MRPCKGVDAIDLNEAEAMKQCSQILGFPDIRTWTQQQVPVQKQAAGTLIIQKRSNHSTSISLIQFGTIMKH